MATVDDSSDGDAESNGPLRRIADPILDGLLMIRGSFLLFVVAVGVVFQIVGIVWAENTLAGMFGIWGASALVYAGLGFVFLRLIGYR